MIKSKKGDVNFIVGILLVIISFFVIGGVLYFTMAEANAKETEIMCKNSIDLRARTQFNLKGDFVGGEIKAIPALCQTIERKISGNREEILEQVAYSMSRCWWMFGEGRYDEILKGSNVKLFPKVFGLEELNNQCFNCYTLLIDQDEIDGGPIGPDEIMKFMNYHNHPQFQNLTYLEYIQSYGGFGRMVFTAPAILPREAYGISFAPKLKEASSVWTGTGLATAGLIVIGVVGVGAVCVLTVGACAAVLTPIAAVVGQSAALTAGVASTTVVSAVGVTGSTLLAGAGTYATYAGYTDIMSNLYGEREFSSIYFGFLSVAQENCGSGEISGD